jgi:autotransporter-associated beta strand protein
VGTLDFNAGTAYTLNSYSGGTMNFTNSFGQDSVVTFTNAANILTSSAGSTGGRSLQNNSVNLDIVFNGSLDIGSSVTDTVNTIGGAGDFVVKGNIFSTTVGSVRGLNKTGAGLLEMRGDNNSYNGNTSIFNGTISVVNGAVLTGTTVRVAPSSGNSGTLLVNGTAGAVVVSARGIVRGGGSITSLQVQDAGTVEVAVGTTWNTGGTIDFAAGSKVLVTGTPAVGQTYTLLKASSDITGSIPTLEGVADWQLAVEGTDLKLKQAQVADGFSQYLVAQSLLPGTAFDAVVNGSKVGLQYAFGSPTGLPQNNGVAAVPVMIGNELTYTFDVRDDSVLNVTYQTSPDLATWSTPQAASPSAGSSLTGFVKKQAQATGSGKLFIRINVTR